MLQHDYLTEVIEQFVEAVTRHLRTSKELEKTLVEAGEVDDAIAGLLDLDPEVAMRLTPDSLVQMMVLTGIGDSVAEYVAYALRRVADVYEQGGDSATAALRIEQARAVEESFALGQDAIPDGFEDLL